MSDSDVIKPYSGEEYKGPPATPDNFAESFPEIAEAALRPTAIIRAGVATPIRARRPLDAESQNNLDQLYLQVRSNPFKPGTVINFHPWPLQFSMTEPYVNGITIRRCPPGDIYAYDHIRGWSPEKKQLPGDKVSYGFTAIRPIQKATQFLREFANPEVYGGGVLIYEGEGHPDKVKRVELYNPDGRPQVTTSNTIEYDNEGRQIPVVGTVPIYGDLPQLILQERHRVDAFYMEQVIWADEMWKTGGKSERKLVTSRHRQMAEVLWKRGIIPAMPDWNIATRLEQGLSENNCQCGAPLAKGTYKCHKCGNIVSALAAYLAGDIDFGHGKIALLSDEDYAVAEAENKRREEVAKVRRGNKKKEQN